MAQRVAFARFLTYVEVCGADILLLDEPFSSLDEALAERMIALLKDASVGRTVAVVMHNRAQAEMLSDNIVYI